MAARERADTQEAFGQLPEMLSNSEIEVAIEVNGSSYIVVDNV